ncbi:methyltransferase domain-containing protein [Spirillospora sp. CA-294931]|uniref:methyltransferase domain-containing protein n=1 Tax=Spirillospora sp. CA-294931 TaxID=3240042 RepID=UPI003D93D136
MSRQAEAIWDPAQYGVFGDERGRAFAELMRRVDIEPGRVADLGCGSGELTATLTRRWPDAIVHGIDASPEMIDAARAHEIPGRLSFGVGDVASWRPGAPTDLIVSNAVLHWVPEHPRLLASWAAGLAPGGRLAFQVPGNFDMPSHVLLRELCESPRWQSRLGGLLRSAPILDPAGYLQLLASRGFSVDAWETTYAQVLQGDDPVLEWMKGSTLRPVLSALGSCSGVGEFLREYAAALREAYPRAEHGTVFPFRRVFVVAGRGP